MKIPEQKNWPWRSRLCRYLEGREAYAIFCLGFLLRIVLLVITRQFEAPGASEPLNVAHSLVRYGSFANPYLVQTGPTATVRKPALPEPARFAEKLSLTFPPA